MSSRELELINECVDTCLHKRRPETYFTGKFHQTTESSCADTNMG